MDECNNNGFLWNCSGLGLNTLPSKFPPELKNQNVTLDLSFNNISEITKETFREISLFCNVTTIKLHHNNFGKIGKNAFSILSSFCSLDISYCSLDKNQIDEYAFVNTKNLRNLKIHHNNFQKTGYPDVSISKIPSLKYLKIDLFEGFVFSGAFENLTELSKIEFNSVETFSLTNDSFQGLERSPIYSLFMFFKMHVKYDVTEDLFCSFPYLTRELSIRFGGYCNVTVALRSLKCLQYRKIEKEGNSFVHDVYVSYSDPDFAWIIQKLYPKLEHLNIKAWFKDKDSIPGAWEAEEIVKCINDSRKVMFVISDSFLDVGWSSYAVQMAVTHAFHNHRQESIVVIIKDNVLLDRLPNDIKNIWWSIEYFRWTESETDEDILDKLSGLLNCK